MPPNNKKKPTPWSKSKAKQLLREDIIAGTVKPEMDAKAVFLMRPEFQLYKLTNFRTNLKNLTEAIAKGPKKPPPPKWGKSPAKELLYEDICTGIIKPEMNGDEVYLMRPEFQLYKLNNFKSNLKNLREAIALDYGRMQRDRKYYRQDRHRLSVIRANDPPEELVWHRHPAMALLEQDVSAGLHKQKKPSELYQSRDEYKDFPPDVFRKHVHQEVTKRDRYHHRYAKKGLRQLGPRAALED